MNSPKFLDRLRAAEDPAWREFLQEYGPLILAAAHCLRLEAEAREDLFQEACVACLRSIHTVRDERRLSSWVYSVAYHLGIDQLRRERARPTEPLDEGETAAPPAEATADALKGLERLERIALVRDALAHLEPRCQDILRALYLEDPPLSYRAAAEQLSLPIGSLGPTRLRCLEKLQKAYKSVSDRPGAASTRRSRAREIADSGGDPALPRTMGPRSGRSSTATAGGKGNDLP